MANHVVLFGFLFAFLATGNQTLTGFSRSCNDDPNICDKDFQMVGGIQNTFITTKCCNTDNCNKHEIQVSEHNNTVNGGLCEVCYGLDSYECNINGYIQCRGDLTECVDIAVTLEKIDSSTFKFSLKGCATPHACTLGPKMIAAAKIVEEKRLSCSPAKRIVQ
ncbi:phospholipase A2 inhibitor gamma subunit B-like isoform X2 [Pelobates fuscus]|uniref:phospholipase A2 inhibitor gamma subunit B-like isoform X2 n=1 Tax=Pelobates fuscus TaxID=191477 RepID=UPI002FE496C2